MAIQVSYVFITWHALIFMQFDVSARLIVYLTFCDLTCLNKTIHDGRDDVDG